MLRIISTLTNRYRFMSLFLTRDTKYLKIIEIVQGNIKCKNNFIFFNKNHRSSIIYNLFSLMKIENEKLQKAYSKSEIQHRRATTDGRSNSFTLFELQKNCSSFVFFCSTHGKDSVQFARYKNEKLQLILGGYISYLIQSTNRSPISILTP